MKIIKPIVLILFLSGSIPTFGSGFPTVDLAAIAQMIKEAATQAKQFHEQMTSIKMQIAEAKKHSGVWGELNNFNNLNANNYLLDKNFESNIEKTLPALRNKFNLNSDNPDIQSRYDGLLKDYAFQETIYNNSVKREKTITALMQQLDKAVTPAQKSAIENNIASQRLQMDNETRLIANRQAMLNQQNLIETKLRQQQWKLDLVKDNF